MINAKELTREVMEMAGIMNRRKIKMPREYEVDIQSAVLEYLNIAGIMAWRNSVQGVIKRMVRKNGIMVPVFGKNPAKGTSDILGILTVDGYGVMLGIETKTKIGRLSEEQRAFIENVNSSGGLAFVAQSVEVVQDNIRIFVEKKEKEVVYENS